MEIVYYLTENQGNSNKSPVTGMDFLVQSHKEMKNVHFGLWIFFQKE